MGRIVVSHVLGDEKKRQVSALFLGSGFERHWKYGMIRARGIDERAEFGLAHRIFHPRFVDERITRRFRADGQEVSDEFQSLRCKNHRISAAHKQKKQNNKESKQKKQPNKITDF